MSDLILVADVHLVEGDSEAPVFHRFLRSMIGRARRCIIVGDLFNVWLARPRFMGPEQRRMMDVLGDVSTRGVRFDYVEGNRDYFVAENWRGSPFHEVAERSLTAESGPTRLLVSHGDLVNAADRPYRAWRAISRSLPVRGLLSLLPSRGGRSLADRLERRLRGTNQRHKSRLPEAALEEHARRAVAAGYSGVVLGHFHTPLRRSVAGGTLWILPDWRDGRRFLRFGPDGEGGFVSFRG